MKRVATSSPTKIVGGEETSIEDYPGLVQVDNFSIFSETWGQNCAGNILSERYILSAAHCFRGEFYAAHYRRIRAGTSYRNTGGVIIEVDTEFNYSPNENNIFDNDISVIRLREDLVFTDLIKQVSIPAQGDEVPDNAPVVYAGWGRTTQSGIVSPELRHVTVYTVAHEVCRTRYLEVARNVTTNMICAGIFDVGGKDACQGDSGGPLYYENILVGVISWGEGCAQDRYPGVSAKVSAYTDWIVSVAV